MSVLCTSTYVGMFMCMFTVSLSLSPLQCVSLHCALQVSPTVLLCGCGCTGKSTAYSVLAAAYRGLRAEGGEGAPRQYPRVKTTVIHATAHTLQEVGGVGREGTVSTGVVLPLWLYLCHGQCNVS